MATSSIYEIGGRTPATGIGVPSPTTTQPTRPLDYISRKATNTIRAQRFDLAVFVDHLAAADVTVDAFFGLRHQALLCYDAGYNPLSVCGFAASGEHRRWVVLFLCRVTCY